MQNTMKEEQEDPASLNQIIQLAEFARKAKDFPEFEYSIYTGVKNKIFHLLLSEFNVCETELEQSAMLMSITPALIEFSLKAHQEKQ